MDMQILIQALIFPGAFILVIAIVNSAWYLRINTCYRWLFAALSLPLGYALSLYHPDPMPINTSPHIKIGVSVLFGLFIGYTIANRNKNCNKK